MAKALHHIVLMSAEAGDDARFGRMLREGLGGEIDLKVYPTAEEGLAACQEPGGLAIDCALVRLDLPDMSGSEAIRRLEQAETGLRLPVVLVIDRGEQCRMAREAVRAGVHDYVVSEWLTADGLACAVESALERFEIGRRLRWKRSEIERWGREFRAIVENVPDMIVRLDLQGRLSYVNPAFERAFNRTAEQLANQALGGTGLDAAALRAWEGAVRGVIEAATEARFEFSIPSPEGERHYQARLVPQHDAGGALHSILAVATDITAARLVAEETKRSEQHLRDVIDRLVAFVGVLTPDGRVLEVNRPALEIAGIDASEVIGQRYEDTYWLSYSAQNRERIRQDVATAAAGELVRHDLEVRVAEGQFMTVDFMLSPLLDEHGVVTHLIASGTDVTDRKRTEREIQALAIQERIRAAEFETLLKSTPVAIWVTKDPECRVLAGNPASCELLRVPEGFNVSPINDGETPDERPYRVFLDGQPIDPEQVPIVVAATRNQDVRHVELTLKFDDGEEKQIYGHASPLRDPSGKAYGAVCAFVDITSLKRAQDALRESELRFRKLAASDIIGIIVSDLGGGLHYVNDEYLRLIGYTREEFDALKPRWTDLTPAEWLPVDERSNEEARARGACTPYEKEYIRRDGSRVPVLVGFTLLDPASEETVAFILDLSERKRFERALEEADRRKDDFLAVLAHELRNPLAAIRTAAHLLRLKDQEDPDLVWGRDVIVRQVGQLTRLIDDLLDVTRIRTGKIQLRMQQLDTRDVVTRAVEAAMPLMAAKQHQLTVDLGDEPLNSHGDAARLQQVVTNLLANAAKYTDQGGRIQVTGAIEDSETVVLRVADNGIGIPADLLPDIFGLFTQIESGMDRSQGGLGIGLTLVRSLVEMHGGSVSASSEGAGRGSEFTIRLRATQQSGAPGNAQPARLAGEAGRSPQGRRGRVLIVDDNEDIARGLAILVGKQGFHTEVTFDATSALASARKSPPDFLLMDLGLPGIDGYELARMIRNDALLRAVVLVAISGYGQPRDRGKAVAAGCDYHLIKPVELDDLIPILERKESPDRGTQ